MQSMFGVSTISKVQCILGLQRAWTNGHKVVSYEQFNVLHHLAHTEN